MNPVHKRIQPDPDLTADTIKCMELALQQQAAAHVTNLRIEASADMLRIQGQARSYYGLQLVIEAVRSFTDGDSGIPVILNVAVESTFPDQVH